MQRCFILISLTLVLLLATAGLVTAADDGGAGDAKRGILLVTFGTTFPEARNAYQNIETETRRAFPETPIYWAYTSHIIRKKMAKDGKTVLSPAQALEKMEKEGYTHVAVQSLHLIAGFEYHDLVKTIRRFEHNSGGLRHITIGRPLLAGPESMTAAKNAIMEIIPEDRKPDQAVVLMGHGTHHPANAGYPALMWRLQRFDKNIYIGTVEGFPGPDIILDRLEKNQAKTAWLLPFMSVAGDHARNDLAGSEKDSWKSIFTDAGIECRPVLKGIGEYDAFAGIWISHLEDALEKL